MVDPERYKEICEWLELLYSVEGTEQQRRLDDLRKRDASLADLVEEMLRSDAEAQHEQFLEDTHSASPHELTPKDNATLADLPKQIGPYQIVEKLGSGGMGVVYRAYHPESHRFVALKLIRSGEFSSQEQVDRFRREAKAAAQMRHPNIVPVYDVGNVDNVDYFTMALIDGADLRSEFGDFPVEPRRAAQLILKIARAVEYAHSKGVIHRDIKPGNLLIDQDGQPMLMDFGLAKSSEIDEAHTRTGQMLGTAAYMAPEQVNDAKNVGPPTDVYGLGATLYYCLTGNAPFSGDDLFQVLQYVRQRSPVAPRTVRPEIDRDLELICLRCLQKDPRERYSSAASLADDLQCYLNGIPLDTATDSLWKSLIRVVRRDESYSDLPSAKAARWIAVLTLVFHTTIFGITSSGQTNVLLWATVAFWFVAVNVINYVYHWSQYWQLTPMERQSGVIQLGTNLSLLCLFAIHGPLSFEEPSSNFLNVYPPFTLVLATALLAHGSIYMGRLLLAGILFFPLAILIAALPTWGPLLLGIGGTIIVGALDIKMQRLLSSQSSG